MFGINVQNGFGDESTRRFVSERRNGAERRKTDSPGFTCITIVGWICRREQIRRKYDPCLFWDNMQKGSADE